MRIKFPKGEVVFWSALIALAAMLLYQRNQGFKEVTDKTLGRIIPA
jgi:hypothetical protein